MLKQKLNLILFSGLKSVLTILKTLGIETNLDELKKLSAYNEVKGVTTEGLLKVVEAKGLYAAEIKINIEELSKLKMPVIVYLWDDSFKAIDKFEQDSVRIIDSEKEPSWMSKKDLDNNYSGFAILISKDKTLFPKIETKGADIRFDEYIHNLGIVKEGNIKLDHIFKFTNIGNKELVISRVKSSCGCTATILSEKNIAPGGKGEIEVSFNIEGRIGSQNTSVYVFSTDPITPIVKLQMKVIIMESKLKVTPASINFGDVKKKSTATAKIYIIPPANEKLSIVKIDSSSEYLSAKFLESKEKDSGGWEVELNLSPDSPLGKLNEKITIYTNNTEQPEIDIPVKGNVKGDIGVQPPKFFFGLAGEISEAKVTLLTTSEEPFNIERIDNPLDFISIKIVPKVEGKEYELIASLKENTPLSSIKGNITIYTNNPEQPTIEIPVYCLVNINLDKT